MQTETLIKGAIKAKWLQELKGITNNQNKIDEIIDRALIRANQVNNGMNILTMKIADRHRTMNVLLEQTDKLIHDTIKAETRRTMGKKVRNRRSYLGLENKVLLHKRYKRDQILSPSVTNLDNQLVAINLANDAGILPDSMSAGLNTINTVQDTLNTLASKGNLVYDTLSNEALKREGDEFTQNIMNQIELQNRKDNKKFITVDEGDEVNIKCFPDEVDTDTSKIVWLRSDGGLLHNFATELESDKLHMAATECSHEGEYKCGIKDGNTWDNINLDLTWNIHEFNVICNKEKKISIAPNSVIGVEGNTITLQCAAPTNSTVQWTKISGINKDQFSKQGLSIQLPTVTTDDAGIYKCTHLVNTKEIVEQIVLQKHKLSVDGTNNQFQSLGFLEAFDCTKEIIKKSSVDLTRTGKCNKDDYMAYSPEKPTIVELIHHRTSEEVLVDACHLTIQLSTAYCRPGNMLGIWSDLFNFIPPGKGGGHGIDGFVTHFTENFDVSEDTCRSAWRTGIFKVDLGKQHVSIPIRHGEPSHTKTSLYLHGYKYTQHYNCTPAYGWHSTGPIYRGQKDPFSDKRSHEVVRAELTLQMKKVFSLVDVNKQRLYIPSAGKEVDLTSMPQESTTMSPSIGTIVILKGNLPLDTCRQYFHIAGGAAKLYIPTNQEDDTIPRLIRFETEIQSDKRVFGLQLMKEINICGKNCSETQFNGILVCEQNSENDFLTNEDLQVLDDLGSNSLALLQVNMDQSIQNLMLHLCLLNKRHMLSAMKDIETHGPSLLNPIHNGRGLRLLQ